jgi:hypothetical protein
VAISAGRLDPDAICTEPLGGSHGHAPTPAPEEYRQSDADGIRKIYHLHVFQMPLPAKPTSFSFGAGLQTEWLTVEEWRTRKPVSSTVPYILQCLEEENKLPPWK